MDQIKIGKFIAECRKQKGLTQKDLAEKLGVTDKSIGNWENGRNMPDLSLFKPLCDELDISMNDLMSGERVNKENYQEKFEKNVISTIDYSTNKESSKNLFLSLFLMCLGLLACTGTLLLVSEGGSKDVIVCLFGLFLFTFGIFRLLNKQKMILRILISMSVCVGMYFGLVYFDYLHVKTTQSLPIFVYKTTYSGGGGKTNIWVYDCTFYRVSVHQSVNGGKKDFYIGYK